jgi:hypothetical protein
MQTREGKTPGQVIAGWDDFARRGPDPQTVYGLFNHGAER